MILFFTESFEFFELYFFISIFLSNALKLILLISISIKLIVKYEKSEEFFRIFIYISIFLFL